MATVGAIARSLALAGSGAASGDYEGIYPFIDSGICYFGGEADKALLSSGLFQWIDKAYRAHALLAEDAGSEAAQRMLDEVRASADPAFKSFAPLITGLNVRMAELVTRLNAGMAEREVQRSEIAGLLAELSAARADLAAVQMNVDQFEQSSGAAKGNSIIAMNIQQGSQ